MPDIEIFMDAYASEIVVIFLLLLFVSQLPAIISRVRRPGPKRECSCGCEEEAELGTEEEEYVPLEGGGRIRKKYLDEVISDLEGRQVPLEELWGEQQRVIDIREKLQMERDRRVDVENLLAESRKKSKPRDYVKFPSLDIFSAESKESPPPLQPVVEILRENDKKTVVSKAEAHSRVPVPCCSTCQCYVNGQCTSPYSKAGMRSSSYCPGHKPKR